MQCFDKRRKILPISRFKDIISSKNIVEELLSRDSSMGWNLPVKHSMVDRTLTGHREEVIYWKGFDPDCHCIDLAMVCKNETDCNKIWEIIRSIQCDN